MSNQYLGDSRRRGGPTGFSSSGNRTALGYWLPLVATVGIATVGLAAWVWSERQDDEDDYDDDNRGNARIGLDSETNSAPSRGIATGIDDGSRVDDASVMARVHGALRRTPSPQEIFDGASKRMAAGVAAVGGALTSIREEDRGDFEDHSMWADEETPTAAGDRELYPTMSGASAPEATSTQQRESHKRKTVAIVVSSVSSTPDGGDVGIQLSEHSVRLQELPYKTYLVV